MCKRLPSQRSSRRMYCHRARRVAAPPPSRSTALFDGQRLSLMRLTPGSRPHTIRPIRILVTPSAPRCGSYQSLP